MIFFLSGRSCSELGSKVSSLCRIPAVRCHFQRFADGEMSVEVKDSVRGADVCLFQSTGPPVNDSYMELFLLLSALKKEGAKAVHLVMSYYGYSRQDRQTSDGQAVSAQCMAELLQKSGVSSCIFLEIHSSRILSFFNIPVQNISALKLLAEEWIKNFPDKDVVCVSPDAGGRKRAEQFAQITSSKAAWIQKLRSRPNQAQAMDLQGCVQGKNAVILDDMIDTAGTLCTAVDKLIECGAKDVFVMAVHGLFSGPALTRIEKSPIRQVWVTDSVKLSPKALECSKIKVLSSAELLSSAVTEFLKTRGENERQ